MRITNRLVPRSGVDLAHLVAKSTDSFAGSVVDGHSRHATRYFPCFFAILAQVSRSVTVRLKTGLSGVLSRVSTQK